MFHKSCKKNNIKKNTSEDKIIKDIKIKPMNNLLQELLSFPTENTDYINESMVNESYYGNYNEYLEHEHISIAGEVALWRAVLLQAFIDLKIKSTNKKYNLTKRKAYEWFKLQKNQQDVKEVCKLTGYEYRKVKQLAKEIIEQSNFKK